LYSTLESITFEVMGYNPPIVFSRVTIGLEPSTHILSKSARPL
jgi:hypothetical protein